MSNWYLLKIIAGSLAAIAGFNEGDTILEVNGIDVKSFSHHEVVDFISECRSGNLPVYFLLKNLLDVSKKTTKDIADENDRLEASLSTILQCLKETERALILLDSDLPSLNSASEFDL